MIEMHGAQIRELTVGLRRDDGSFHILGTVGTGFSDMERMEWYQKLAPLEMPSSFRMANREGTLCRFVRPEVVIEIKCSDLVSVGSTDAPVRRMTLKYDEKDGWEALGNMPFVSMLHPVFLRERTDKSVDAGSVGLDQVYRHIPFDDRDGQVEEADLPRAEIMRRGVYIKETKGSVAVRKYVALATNKSDVDPDYPPFVVHFTDYSPNRKQPLQTSLKVAGTTDSVDGHIASWLEDN
ncbi:MAG: hypothetical protein ACNA8W_17030, partial [Bradymonadaceae bacterium]